MSSCVSYGIDCYMYEPVTLNVHARTQPPRIVTFNIGSVDAFERNLDQAQRDLGIDSSHFIPVTYPADPNWLQKAFVSVLPTLLILGTLVYFSRRMSSGASGRGVSGGKWYLISEDYV